MKRFSLLFFLSATTLIAFSGCLQDPNPPAAEKKREGIIGKTTDQIGEFKAGEAKQADLAIDSSRPMHAMTAGAYKNILGQAAKIQITQAVNLFNAEHGRYPKDHEEFMEMVVKPNQIQLPVLPGGVEYQYDVENHELKIVEAQK